MIRDTYKITTLGCKVNKAESIEIERQFYENGYRRAAGDEVPEYWIINTCAVTAAGMQKSRKAVRKCLKAGANVIVTGCGVDFDENEFKSMGPARLVSNMEKEKIPDDICGRDSGREWSNGRFREVNCRIPVKVQDGCAQNCSYCVVPKLRTGRWSLEKESVIEKVKFYKDIGAGEIILCGIDLGNYRDRIDGTDLVGLVESVLKSVPGIWIRLSSISLRDVTGKLIKLLESDNGLCRHVHIPLQSGDDSVLKSMNRGYSRGEYLEKVGLIREIVPDISITTDVMVGYPAESEDAFSNTLEIIRQVGFSKVHVFRYSPRPDTGAFELKDPVPGMEKKRRSRIIADESQRQAEAFHAGFIGRNLDVLVEEESNEVEGELMGRTSWYSEVRLKGSPGLVGKKVDVLIDDIDGVMLSGMIINA